MAKMSKYLPIVVGAAAVGGLIYLLTRNAQGNPPGTINFSCAAEAVGVIRPDESALRPEHPCWGNFHTHTYHFGARVMVTGISGFVTTGTQSTDPGVLEVQLSLDGLNWETIGEAHTDNSVGAYPFAISLDSPICAAHLRFIGTTLNPNPSCCVDHSSGAVVYSSVC